MRDQVSDAELAAAEFGAENVGGAYVFHWPAEHAADAGERRGWSWRRRLGDWRVDVEDVGGG